MDELLAVVFHPSKFIQIFGKPDQFRYEYPFYPVYRVGGIVQCHLVNIQDDFKAWYNNTFVHNENCG
ncbi:unnamed protein product [Rotaria sp. Silwood2]|nr:unnamed protein product [Rotaria sp. Silwood2]